jgi:preprotein translocase subunit SecA
MKLRNFYDKATANPVVTDLSPYEAIINRIKERDLKSLPDREFGARMIALHAQARGAPLDINTPLDRDSPPDARTLVDVFALVREASCRAVGLDPFDVQMIAGLAMVPGGIAELPTGEGKTLAAVFPACLHALAGRGVHVLTFNDYLARRDAAWMGPIYRLLGLSVGCAQEGTAPAAKRAAYAADVTYATAKEAGFDYLRDRIAYETDDLVHRPFHAAIIDEADSILIDEARIPLVISGVEDRATWDARNLAGVVRRLAEGRDYETDAERRNVFLTDAGILRVESLLGGARLYQAGNERLLEAVYCALHAQALLGRDVDYIVRDGRIEIVDEFTGRVVAQRHWPDGLQAAVEAKEGLARKSEGRILGSITLQHFFRLYPRLAGMTATARSAANELKEFYGLTVTIVPPHIPSVRSDAPDAVFTHRLAKREALVREIGEAHAAGRPVLAGTGSVKESEELASDLRGAGVACAVLNARNDELEAGIVAEAGLPGAVTISTNMAGRGTDIKLGGAEERERARAVAVGGLYVIGTNRHESLRIDRQLRGRAGRQGDPGSTQFFISLEDDLFVRYGLSARFVERYRLERRRGELPAGRLQADVAHVQRIIEGQNFDIRRSLTKFTTLVELQRRMVGARRDAILAGTGESVLKAADPAFFDEGVSRFGAEKLALLERRAALFHIDRLWSDHLAWVQDTRETIHLVGLGGKTPIDEFQKSGTAAFMELERSIDDCVLSEMENVIHGDGSAELALERLKGPSSTWTYLVNEDQFGWGVELLKGRNIGFASVAAGAFGPLFVMTLIARRIFGRKGKQGETPTEPPV